MRSQGRPRRVFFVMAGTCGALALMLGITIVIDSTGWSYLLYMPALFAILFVAAGLVALGTAAELRYRRDLNPGAMPRPAEGK